MDVGSKPVRGWLIKKGRHAMGAALHGTSAGYNFASTPRVSAYRNGCWCHSRNWSPPACSGDGEAAERGVVREGNGRLRVPLPAARV